MRVAILGAGSMGETHAQAYASMPDVELAAIFARSLTRAGLLADKLGCLATIDLATILADPGIDAVDVCLPSNLHREFVISALRAGKDVFCETPLALSLADAQAMQDVARSSRRLLLVALLMRAIDANAKIREAILSGEIGRVLAAHAYRLGSYLRPESAEHKAHYGDPTTELMTFDYDLLNWLFGLPDEVYAAGSTGTHGSPGHVCATLRYPDFVATVEASGVMPVGFPFSVGLRVVGERKAVEFSAKFGVGEPAIAFMSYDHAAAQRLPTTGGNPYETECRYFVDCVNGKADPEMVSAERALEALQLSVATQQSLREGRPVRLGPLAESS